MKKGDIVANVLRVPVDFALLVGAGVFVYVVRTQALASWRPVLFSLDLPFTRFMGLTLVVSGLFVVIYAFSGLYSMKRRMTQPEEMARVTIASAAAIMAVVMVIFLQQSLFNSRFLVVGYWVTATVWVIVGRACFRLAYRHAMARTGIGAHRVLLIGADEVSERIARTITGDPGLGYRIIRRLDEPDTDAIGVVIREEGGVIDEIMLADPNYAPELVTELVDFCNDRHIQFTFVPNIHRTLTTHWDVDAIGQTPIVQLRRTALVGWGRIFKRITDIVGSTFALVLLSPVFAVIAFAIKWETAGPVFVRLERMSRNRRFVLFKFRSMIENAEELKPLLTPMNERADGPLFKMHDDPRVTAVGRMLRRTRLDELPQFFNVFRGDISLVGPRPHQSDEIAKYERHHRKVLAIKAGATGLAQISGSSDLPFEEEVALDTFYIENWSFMLDVRILARTVLLVFRDRSAV
ncbi:MAG TPA: sugar transferase [Candidatus Paceibacterota bacterium]|nr:sugar transferase [Candidatus Paceibacterota bacterium]